MIGRREPRHLLRRRVASGNPSGALKSHHFSLLTTPSLSHVSGVETWNESFQGNETNPSHLKTNPSRLSVPYKLFLACYYKRCRPSSSGDSRERGREMTNETRRRMMMWRHEQAAALMEHLRPGDRPNIVTNRGQCSRPLMGSSCRIQDCASCRHFETTSNGAPK